MAESSDMSTTVQRIVGALFRRVDGWDNEETTSKSTTKISVVGVGNVGMACAQTILTQDIADEIALVDVDGAKLRGEMLDLQHGSAFLPRVKIVASTHYEVTKGSDLCIVTAGARQREGESRLNLVQRNIAIFKSIIPELVRHSPETILLIVSNPVDLLSYVAWKLSGLPAHRVIGSGTNLDSSRFRFLIADRLDINSQNVHAYIIGEHGDSSVPLWSSLTVGGVPIKECIADNGILIDQQQLDDIHKLVVDSALEIISLKGYTSWAIGYSVAVLANSLLRNQRRIHPVSVLANGFHGIKDDVYLSLPAQLGSSGVVSIMNSHLSDEEQTMLQDSAEILWDIQQGLSF